MVFALMQGLCAPSAWAQTSGGLTIFAAASLKTALDGVAQDFTAANGIQVSISYAASSTLAKQIEQGAPADVFISADLDWMDYLAQRKLIDVSTRFNFLRNRLVLIAPASTPGTGMTIGPGFALATALGPGRLAMADVMSVPAGKYGKAALTTLGVWEDVKGRIAQAENVRAALAFIALGEAALGIVYQSDAIAEPRVRIVGVFPSDSHPEIVYPIAKVAGSQNKNAAAFLAFLRSPTAKARFKQQGFLVLE